MFESISNWNLKKKRKKKDVDCLEKDKKILKK